MTRASNLSLTGWKRSTSACNNVKYVTALASVRREHRFPACEAIRCGTMRARNADAGGSLRVVFAG